MVNDRRACPDAESLAALAEGRLKRSEIAAMLGHTSRCGRCMRALEGANAAIPREVPRTRWLAAAAILVAALLALPLLRVIDRDPTARLSALAPQHARVIEPRVSGGFEYAPYRGPMRAGGTSSDTRDLKLKGLAGELVEQAETKKTAEAQHAAGVALLFIDDPAQAARHLRQAVGQESPTAQAWSDLAAAQYAEALRNDKSSLYPVALDSADAALRIHPRLPEALFNRALILERLGLTRQARDAWERYLAVDPSSPWADEARARLAALPSETAASVFDRDLPLLERAAAADDQKAIDALVARHPQRSRTYAEAEFLGQWGGALQRGDTATAARHIDLARHIADALSRSSGEALLRDAVRSIDSAADPSTLASAHALYRKARMTYGRMQPAAAEPGLRDAAGRFAAAGSPMSLVARYFAASTRFDRGDVRGARAELETLLAEADAIPHYHALGAQIRWQLILCHIADHDWGGVPPIAAEAHRAFDQLGERSNVAVIETLLAGALTHLGRPDDAWAARIRAFAIESGEARADRLAVSVGGTARLELRGGRTEAARALLRVEQEIERAGGYVELLGSAIVTEAVLSVETGDHAAARALVNDARAVAKGVKDPTIRERLTAHANFAEGAALAESDPRRAFAPLTAAIGEYEASERYLFLPEAYLYRARAALRLGDEASARRDLDRGIAIVERGSVDFAPTVRGSGILDAGAALFHESIRLSAKRGDVAAAFAYIERSRAGLASDGRERVTLVELQDRLAGSDAAVLQLAVLPDEVVAVGVTADRAAIERHPLGRAELQVLAARVERDDDHASRELFDVLIRPSERAIGRAGTLVIIADPPLDNVPFAALYDSVQQRHLIERMAVVRAVSTTSLRPTAASSAPRSVTTIVLPTGSLRGSAALPETGEEARDLAAIYARASAVAAERATYSAFVDAAVAAEVVHIAGHTERQAGHGDSALVFADGRRVSWSTIAARRLDARPVVVLAACETLRVPDASHSFSMSLGGGFLAAGARDVVGTLVPIADGDARALFRDVHRHLASGLDAASAVREAQLAALSDRSNHQRAAWRAISVLTTSLPRARG